MTIARTPDPLERRNREGVSVAPEAAPPSAPSASGAHRSFEIAGAPRVAPCAVSASWTVLLDLRPIDLPERLRARLEEHWRRVAQAAHASIASFSRLNLELLALGAPAGLVAASTGATSDAVRCARDAFAIASVFAGAPLGPGRLPLGGALERSEDPVALLLATIRDGCLGQTLGAAVARAAARSARDAALRELLGGLADTGSRHADLAWAVARWMLEERPELRAVARRAFDEHTVGPAPAPDPDRDALAAHGALTDDAAHEVAARTHLHVVRACAALLLGPVGGTRVSA